MRLHLRVAVVLVSYWCKDVRGSVYRLVGGQWPWAGSLTRCGSVQGYVKAPLSARNGIGALSLGLIVDHTFEI